MALFNFAFLHGLQEVCVPSFVNTISRYTFYFITNTLLYLYPSQQCIPVTPLCRTFFKFTFGKSEEVQWSMKRSTERESNTFPFLRIFFSPKLSVSHTQRYDRIRDCDITIKPLQSFHMTGLTKNV